MTPEKIVGNCRLTRRRRETEAMSNCNPAWLAPSWFHRVKASPTVSDFAGERLKNNEKTVEYWQNSIVNGKPHKRPEAETDGIGAVAPTFDSEFH